MAEGIKHRDNFIFLFVIYKGAGIATAYGLDDQGEREFESR
jgi:hypothetical protein